MQRREPDRSTLLRKLQTVLDDIEHAGPVHRRDLTRHIRRLKRQLRDLSRSEKAMTQ